MPTLQLVLWAANTLIGLLLFCLILKRRLDRAFPFLTAYLGVNLLQTFAQVAVYETYGFRSRATYATVWGAQAVVILARTLVTCEFCHRVLGRYVGVWALAVRILLVCGAIVLGLALYFGQDGFRYGVMTLEIAAEGLIATLVAGTFVFARYYEAQTGRSELLLGVGLGVNSCLKILNDVVLSRYFTQYGRVWNDVGMVTFGCVLLLWILAMRVAEAPALSEPKMHGAEVYRLLAPQMNRRLAELNRQLTHLLKPEQPRL